MYVNPNGLTRLLTNNNITQVAELIKVAFPTRTIVRIQLKGSLSTLSFLKYRSENTIYRKCTIV